MPEITMGMWVTPNKRRRTRGAASDRIQQPTEADCRRRGDRFSQSNP